MKTVRSLLEAPLRKSTEGTVALRSWRLWIARSFSDSPLTAVMAIGTCCSDSSR
ncbi:hypothetical protein D3C81_2011900 [compost metagenome]